MDSPEKIWGFTNDGGFREVLIVPTAAAMQAVQSKMDKTPEAWGWTMDISTQIGRDVALLTVNFATETRHRELAWDRYSQISSAMVSTLGAAAMLFAHLKHAEQEASDPRVTSQKAIQARREAIFDAAEAGGGVLRLLLGKHAGHRGLHTYEEWSALWNEHPSVLQRLTYGD